MNSAAALYADGGEDDPVKPRMRTLVGRECSSAGIPNQQPADERDPGNLERKPVPSKDSVL
jgi:hypothetical protein